MNVKKTLVNLGAVAYSCGTGQAVAVPGSVISFITAGVFKLKEYHYVKKAKKLKPDSENHQARVQRYHEKAAKSADSVNKAMRCGVGFLIGGIPIGGAHMGLMFFSMTSPKSTL